MKIQMNERFTWMGKVLLGAGLIFAFFEWVMPLTGLNTDRLGWALLIAILGAGAWSLNKQ